MTLLYLLNWRIKKLPFDILLAGFDEAGRGPLAGPVYAACVILPKDFPIEILNDSKKLSEKKRLAAEKIIIERACYGVAFVDHKKIDQINILNASLLAMSLSYEKMIKKLPLWAEKNNINLKNIKINAITDGNFCPILPIDCRAEVKADSKYPCVMAASILAKNERDRFMIEMDKKYPEYGYAKHKGYPTKAHKAACREKGPSPIQRLSFKY